MKPVLWNHVFFTIISFYVFYFICGVESKHFRRLGTRERIKLKRSAESTQEELQNDTDKSFNKVMEDSMAYYESVRGRKRPLIDDLRRINTSSTNSQSSVTNQAITTVSNSFQSLLQEINRKMADMTSPSTKITTTLNELNYSEHDSSLVNTKVSSTNALSDSSTTTSSVNPIHSLLTPPLIIRERADKIETSTLSTVLTDVLQSQKDIVNKLLMNIEHAQKVLNDGETTEYHLEEKQEQAEQQGDTSENPINDISRILMKLAEVENVTTNKKNVEKDKEKNKNIKFASWMQRFLKSKNLADIPLDIAYE